MRKILILLSATLFFSHLGLAASPEHADLLLDSTTKLRLEPFIFGQEAIGQMFEGLLRALSGLSDSTVIYKSGM